MRGRGSSRSQWFKVLRNAIICAIVFYVARVVTLLRLQESPTHSRHERPQITPLSTLKIRNSPLQSQSNKPATRLPFPGSRLREGNALVNQQRLEKTQMVYLSATQSLDKQTSSQASQPSELVGTENSSNIQRGTNQITQYDIIGESQVHGLLTSSVLPKSGPWSLRTTNSTNSQVPFKGKVAEKDLQKKMRHNRYFLDAVAKSEKYFPDNNGFPRYSRLEPIFFPFAWQAFKAFIAAGPEAFPIYLDETCTLGRTWKREREMSINIKRGPKYAQEALIPFRMRLSRWHTSSVADAKASVIVSFARTQHQRLRLDCLHRLKTGSPSYNQATSFFLYAGDRGPCCDGGQYAQPDWLSHHIIATHGEEPSGPFVFREGKGAHQYSTNDTAPPISCFDPAKDIGIPASATLVSGPPEAFDRVQSYEVLRSCTNRSTQRDLLVMFAGGRSSPREYELRKKTLVHWAEGKNVKEFPDVRLRYSMDRAEHNETMWNSKFCLVVEGYAPWTPRLEEAIAASCVPVIMSQRWRGPYYDLIDYTKFALVLEDPFTKIDKLRDILIEKVISGEYAQLFCHLQIIKPLFRFRKDSKGSEDEDMIPMLVFEMYNKLYEPPTSDASHSARPRPTSLPPVKTTSDGWLRVHEVPPHGLTVTYTCESEGRTCLVDVGGDEWNCSSIMEPTQDYPLLDEDGDFKQCTCFRKDKIWIMPPSIRRSIPKNYWKPLDPPAQNRNACPPTTNYTHRQWRACPGEF